MTTFHVIIPARYESARLSGKLLLEIAGKTVLQHVYEQAVKSQAQSVTIATDDDRIASAATAFGADVCMTSSDHRNGTDRLAEAASIKGFADDELIVNVQADEPLIPPEIITQVAVNLETHSDASISTLYTRMTSLDDIFDTNHVKVVTDREGYAIYFSRAVIPWDRDNFTSESRALTSDSNYFLHVGLYAYRVSFIKQYVNWAPCHLEQVERLEQLRALWYGHKIHVGMACVTPPPDINSQEDFDRVEKLFLESQHD